MRHDSANSVGTLFQKVWCKLNFASEVVSTLCARRGHITLNMSANASIRSANGGGWRSSCLLQSLPGVNESIQKNVSTHRSELFEVILYVFKRCGCR